MKSCHNQINKNKITQQHLKECMNYDQNTGLFVWKKRPSDHFSSEAYSKTWNTKWADKEAGVKTKRGYIYLTIDYIQYAGHRLAFLYLYGYLPEGLIDHIDRIKHHNWITNLREASNQCNIRNSGLSSANNSGVKGVGFNKAAKKWKGNITVNQKTIHLGSHDLFSDAVLKRWEAEVLHKFPNCCTDSSAYNYLRINDIIPMEVVV